MNERLKILIDELKNRRIVHNYADFASQMGKPRSIISELINGKRTISELFVIELTAKYPFINEDWLFSGEGEMLKQSETPTVEQPEEKPMADRLLFLIESQKKDIETLIQLVKEKDDKINELLDELNARKKDAAPRAGLSSSVNAG